MTQPRVSGRRKERQNLDEFETAETLFTDTREAGVTI